MEGTASEPGVVLRGIKELFRKIQDLKSQTKRQVNVFVSFYQIYNEKVYDLLNSDPNVLAKRGDQGLRIRWSKKEQFVVENLYIFEAATAQEATELFKFGSRNRVLASHNLNDVSSRSHCIFSLTIESTDLQDPNNITVSKL